jgi:hypothetical protein
LRFSPIGGTCVGMKLRAIGSGTLLTTVVVSLVTVLTPAAAWAQSTARGGSAEGRGSGAPPMRVNTPFEDFVEALRLDDRSQVPETQRLMTGGASGAAGLVKEMIQARQQLLNLEANGRAEEKGPVLAAYANEAARMAAAEAATFGQVYALLRPNQHSRAPRAFDQMAGFFFPQPDLRRVGRSASGAALGRLDILTNLFSLDGDQKREIRTWLDAAHKAQADTRKGLADTRAALLDAVRAGGDQAAIDAAAAAYATHVTTMTDAEMAVFAKILLRLSPEQRDDQQAVGTAFHLMRGIFVNASHESRRE